MKKLSLVLLVVLIPILLTGCPFDTQQAPILMDLPMPATIHNSAVIGLMKVGDTENMSVMSPGVTVEFINTGVGIQSEQVSICDGQNTVSATMNKYQWRDEYLNGTITSAIDYSPAGNIVDARIVLTIDKGSFINFVVNSRYSVDRSRFIYQFLPDENGKLILRNAFYYEEWGLDSDSTVCFGLTAGWHNLDNINLFSRFQNWGFWETSDTPFQMVVDSLEIARQNLKKGNTDLLSYDKDSLSEIFGQQSGSDVFVNNKPYCQVRYEYSHFFGSMPNTECVSGSLTKVSWNFTNGEYRSLVIRSSQLVERPSSVFIFCKSKEEEKAVSGQEWLNLYGEVTENHSFVLYAAGAVGEITKYDSEGKSIDVGEGGGVFYGFIHKTPKVEDILQLRRLLDLIGLPGIKALGFYYPTAAGSGNGIHYFLSIMAVKLSNNMGQYDVGDIGLLDRVGLPVTDPLNIDGGFLPFNGVYEGSPSAN